MKQIDPIEAHLTLLDWGRWDPADPPEIVHAVVPRDFSDDAPLARLQHSPREWHAVVNNLVMEADQKFGHRRWFDMQSPWRGLVSGADAAAFYAYQSINEDTRDRIATVWCYPDGTIVSRSRIVGPHMRPRMDFVAIEEVADSLAATMWFAATLQEAVSPHKGMECTVRSALASAHDLKLEFTAGGQTFHVVQIEPTRFLGVPGELDLRLPDEHLESRIASIASWQRCWERLKPLYRAAQA